MTALKLSLCHVQYFPSFEGQKMSLHLARNSSIAAAQRWLLLNICIENPKWTAVALWGFMQVKQNNEGNNKANIYGNALGLHIGQLI